MRMFLDIDDETHIIKCADEIRKRVAASQSLMYRETPDDEEDIN